LGKAKVMVRYFYATLGLTAKIISPLEEVLVTIVTKPAFITWVSFLLLIYFLVLKRFF